MNTLLEAINKTFLKTNTGLPYNSVMDFLQNDEKSAEFIRTILHDEDYIIPNEESSQYEFSKARARHSAITYLIGLVFSEFGNLSEKISFDLPLPSNKRNSFQHLWMLTALYHDWGYYSDRLKNNNIVFRKEVKHYLFQDSYTATQLSVLEDYSVLHKEALAYTYEEIEEYDRYARNYHANEVRTNEKEKMELVDHGILGGVFVFDRLIRKELRTVYKYHTDELFSAKTACLTIAQHNIFKSNSIKRDLKYGEKLRKLYHDSNFVINEDTPLLLLLCLVDTFECVKKFSKGEVKEDSFQTNTVLSSIKIHVSHDEIEIDYSDLEKRVKQKNNQNTSEVFKNYMSAMRGLNKWTCLYFDESKNYCRIRLNKSSELVATY